MKIYLFDPETCVYQGEDFTDDLSMCQEREAVPPHATTIAPPPYRRGEVPVFRITENKWEIRPIHSAEAKGDADPGQQASRLSKLHTFRPTNDSADELV
jgi:hypothetical protein